MQKYKRYMPVFLSLSIVLGLGYAAVQKKQNDIQAVKALVNEKKNIGQFSTQTRCARTPQFLKSMNIPQPVIINLTQKQHKGIALHYGKRFSKVLHLKEWEKFEHFGTYAMDNQGDIYLVPTPFISIHPNTLDLQKNIYKLSSKTAEITKFMHFDDVHPSATNPYGLHAITYDCKDKSLWVAAIDESNYATQKGVIYNVDPIQKTVRSKMTGIDVLSMARLTTSKGEYLLAGSARDSGLYAYKLSQRGGKHEKIKLFKLPLPNARIRKIKVKAANLLEIQSVPFSYSLIAQSAKKDRIFYTAKWNEAEAKWIVTNK